MNSAITMPVSSELNHKANRSQKKKKEKKNLEKKKSLKP